MVASGGPWRTANTPDLGRGASICDAQSPVEPEDLPQVAAQADWQWSIAKEMRNGTTTSSVCVLDREARIGEIARMLGGERLATSVAHAQELLGSAAVAASPAKPCAKERRGAK